MKENLIAETNGRLEGIINNLTTIREEYEKKLDDNDKEIYTELERVQKYKTEFFESKAKIEKMNSDIEGFESDYRNLVEKFKDDELANILIAANKEISLKIDERKRKILKDKSAMNELVDKAENVKQKLVKLTAEKKTLELCLSEIIDAFDFYSQSLNKVMSYANDNISNLSACFKEDSSLIDPDVKLDDNSYDNEIVDETIMEDYSDLYSTEYDTNSIPDFDNEDIDEFGTVDLSDMIKVNEEPEITEEIQVNEETEVNDYDNENIINSIDEENNEDIMNNIDENNENILNNIDEENHEEVINDIDNEYEISPDIANLIQEIQFDVDENEHISEEEDNQEPIEDVEIVEEDNIEVKEEKNKKKKKSKHKEFNVDDFDDELHDDNSLYEE